MNLGAVNAQDLACQPIEPGNYYRYKHASVGGRPVSPNFLDGTHLTRRCTFDRLDKCANDDQPLQHALNLKWSVIGVPIEQRWLWDRIFFGILIPKSPGFRIFFSQNFSQNSFIFKDFSFSDIFFYFWDFVWNSRNPGGYRKSREFFGIGNPHFLVKIHRDLKSPGLGFFFRGIGISQ